MELTYVPRRSLGLNCRLKTWVKRACSRGEAIGLNGLRFSASPLLRFSAHHGNGMRQRTPSETESTPLPIARSSLRSHAHPVKPAQTPDGQTDAQQIRHGAAQKSRPEGEREDP
jgi:hypothetical protein